jgi:hypothetical protein
LESRQQYRDEVLKEFVSHGLLVQLMNGWIWY